MWGPCLGPALSAASTPFTGNLQQKEPRGSTDLGRWEMNPVRLDSLHVGDIFLNVLELSSPDEVAGGLSC